VPSHKTDEAGDMWDYPAVVADSTFVIFLIVGKRTYEQTQEPVHDIKSRLRLSHLPAIFTDSYEGYGPAILVAFGRRDSVPRYGKGGRPSRPQRRWPQGLAYGQVKKLYKGGRVERIDVKVLYGKAGSNTCCPCLAINTCIRVWWSIITAPVVSVIDGRCVRPRVCQTVSVLSVDELAVGDAVQFLLGVWEPAAHARGAGRHRSSVMAAGLADHSWTTRQWLLYPILGG
jgi:hypothetical protein